MTQLALLQCVKREVCSQSVVLFTYSSVRKPCINDLSRVRVAGGVMDTHTRVIRYFSSLGYDMNLYLVMYSLFSIKSLQFNGRNVELKIK